MQNPQGSAGEVSTVYAGFFIRLAAYLLDLLIVNLVLIPFHFIFFVIYLIIAESFLTRQFLFQYNLYQLFCFALVILYFVCMTYCTGQTLGKMIFEIKVISVKGEKLGFWNVVYRETVARFLSSLLGIGYMMIGVEAQKNGLHDNLSDTRVIYRYRKIGKFTVVKIPESEVNVDKIKGGTGMGNGMDGEMIAVNDGTKLFFMKQEAVKAKAVLVMVHGLCEHLGRYDYVSGELVKAGITTYRFDHRGHGKSEGKRVFYNDFNEIIEDVNVFVEKALSENPNRPVYVLGHSMGGYAVTCFATKYPGKAKGIVLSGALTRYQIQCAGPLPIDAPADTYMPNALGSGVCSDPAVVEAYNQDPLVEKEISVGLLNTIYEGVEWLKKNPDLFTDPVLLLHGCCDGLVSEKDSRDLFGEIASKDKELKIYANLYHEILNEPCRDEIIRDIVQWINHRI